MRSLLSRTVLSILVALVMAGTAPAQTAAPPQLDPQEAQSFLQGYLTDELKIPFVQVSVEGKNVMMALNADGDDAGAMLGKVGLMFAAGGAVAPWSDMVRVSVYTQHAPFMHVHVPTASITAYLEGGIDEATYIGSWVFEEIAELDAGQGTAGQGQPPAQAAGTALLLPDIADGTVYAYSYRNWNQTNWGAWDYLGAGWHPTGGEKRSYLRFDLSGLTGQQVARAELRLSVSHVDTEGATRLPLAVYRVTSPWIEGHGVYVQDNAAPAAPGELSWAQQPSFDPMPVAVFDPGGQVQQVVQVDVTPLVADWQSGAPNYGLMIAMAEPPGPATPVNVFGFRSREAGSADLRPALVVTTGGQAASAGQIGTAWQAPANPAPPPASPPSGQTGGGFDAGAQAGTGSNAVEQPPASPPASYYTPKRGSAERKALMDAARVPVSAELGQRVIFVVDTLRSDGHWAFMIATPVQPDGAPLDWRTTPFADAINEGMMSDMVMVLFERQGGSWQVVDHVLGPTDVYWYNWVDSYGLPESLFFPG